MPISLVPLFSSAHVLHMPNNFAISADPVKCRTSSLCVRLTTTLAVLYFLDFSLLIFDQIDIFVCICASVLIVFFLLFLQPLQRLLPPSVLDFLFITVSLSALSLIPNTSFNASMFSTWWNSHRFAVLHSPHFRSGPVCIARTYLAFENDVLCRAILLKRFYHFGILLSICI